MRVRVVLLTTAQGKYTVETLRYMASKYNRAHKDVDDSHMIVDDGKLTYCGEEPCQKDAILTELGMESD